MKGVSLESIINQEEKLNIRESLTALLEYLKTNEEKKIDELVSALQNASHGSERVEQSNQKILELLQKVFDKEIPTPIVNVPAPVVNVEAPNITVKPTKVDVPAPIVNIDLSGLKDLIVSEGEKTREILAQLLDKDFGRTSVSNTTIVKPKWRIATFPQTAGTQAITRVAGSNSKFYLPWSPVLNSEAVRLNGGAPLSAGVDYTITSNQIAFARDIESDEKMEIRAQT